MAIFSIGVLLTPKGDVFVEHFKITSHTIRVTGPKGSRSSIESN